MGRNGPLQKYPFRGLVAWLALGPWPWPLQKYPFPVAVAEISVPWLGLGRCSYAVLMDAEEVQFQRTTYTNTTDFNDTSIGRAPVVMDWAIRDGTSSCEVAKRNHSTYACLSSNSECVVSPNGPGYLCNCSSGYEGNPYLPDGCHGSKLSTVPKI